MKPALTAEEWAAGESVRWMDADYGEAIEADADSLCITHVYRDLPGRDALGTCNFAGSDRYALAAFALYGQSFGFTWDDVELIRAALSVWDGTALNDDGDLEYVSNRFDDRARSVADRIAALLPPREKMEP